MYVKNKIFFSPMKKDTQIGGFTTIAYGATDALFNSVNITGFNPTFYTGAGSSLSVTINQLTWAPTPNTYGYFGASSVCNFSLVDTNAFASQVLRFL